MTSLTILSAARTRVASSRKAWTIEERNESAGDSFVGNISLYKILWIGKAFTVLWTRATMAWFARTLKSLSSRVHYFCTRPTVSTTLFATFPRDFSAARFAWPSAMTLSTGCEQHSRLNLLSRFMKYRIRFSVYVRRFVLHAWATHKPWRIHLWPFVLFSRLFRDTIFVRVRVNFEWWLSETVAWVVSLEDNSIW